MHPVLTARVDREPTYSSLMGSQDRLRDLERDQDRSCVAQAQPFAE
jgi:hypothetical protein